MDKAIRDIKKFVKTYNPNYRKNFYVAAKVKNQFNKYQKPMFISEDRDMILAIVAALTYDLDFGIEDLIFKLCIILGRYGFEDVYDVVPFYGRLRSVIEALRTDSLLEKDISVLLIRLYLCEYLILEIERR